ncbi:MAG: NrpR regulatory domain-containing protein, partial [Kiritimatiellia bacterium]|nr:NrpR regulatory domain-containing protein [Kiritimatiellia bacterium]
EGKPVRFTQTIQYDGTTIDPVEIFTRGRMMSVQQVLQTGSGLLGASFREIPAAALSDARSAIALMRVRALDGVLAVGRPGRPLLGIPVQPGRAGLVVAAGLNPIAALEESGIETLSRAMACMADVRTLVEPNDSL